ncbi:MAG: cation:proton antiporter [Tenericutes bacterium HGW-Tenericutes-2]|jgi:multicomponent Na+:H+ antiporter subunit F|nr:MAG: cation:proton antiporter [Tenericutes bacterium HGW-Tenericutes-2]PKM70560.1 MAG: cation:proton antiporter [Firmicutes bacterium HGW-Firmicutes-18]
MIEYVIIGCAIFLVLLSFVGLYRAYKGPTAADRIVAINVISTKVTVVIVLIALWIKQGSYVNVALIYAMIGFITTIGVAKYLLKGRLDA